METEFLDFIKTFRNKSLNGIEIPKFYYEIHGCDLSNYHSYPNRTILDYCSDIEDKELFIFECYKYASIEIFKYIVKKKQFTNIVDTLRNRYKEDTLSKFEDRLFEMSSTLKVVGSVETPYSKENWHSYYYYVSYEDLYGSVIEKKVPKSEYENVERIKKNPFLWIIEDEENKWDENEITFSILIDSVIFDDMFKLESFEENSIHKFIFKLTNDEVVRNFIIVSKDKEIVKMAITCGENEVPIKTIKYLHKLKDLPKFIDFDKDRLQEWNEGIENIGGRIKDEIRSGKINLKEMYERVSRYF